MHNFSVWLRTGSNPTDIKQFRSNTWKSITTFKITILDKLVAYTNINIMFCLKLECFINNIVPYRTRNHNLKNLMNGIIVIKNFKIQPVFKET